MRDLLFQTPWWLPTILIAAGVVLFVSGNKRLQNGLRNAGLALAALGLLVAVVSYLVDTDVEKVEKRAKQLVESVGRQDWGTAEQLMDPQAHFAFRPGGRNYGDRAAILDAARAAAGRNGLRSAWVASVTPQQTGGTITTAMRIFSDQEQLGHQIPSDWQIDWEKEGGYGPWVVSEIRLLSVGNVSADEISQHLR